MEYITLKDIAVINMGQSPESKTYNEEKKGIPFYQGKSDFGKINPIPRVWCSNPIKIAEKDDILISVRAPIGDTNIATEKCCIGRGLASIRPLNENINKKYLYYLLNSKYKELNKFGTGSTFKAITKENLCNLKCAGIPDIKEQIEVVKKMDNVSQIIEIKKKQLEELSIIIKSQFVEMFGDPIDNPKNNKIVKLSDIAEYWNGLTYKPTDVSKEGTIVLRSSNIQNSQLDFEDVVRVNCNIKEKQFVKENDILMCSRNGSARLVGKVAVIQDIKEEMTFGAFMMIIRSIYYPYLFSYFQTDAFRSQIKSGATTTINQITGNMLNKIKLPLPDIEEINKFADFVKQIDKQKFESVIKAEKEIEKIQKNIYYKWGR